MKRFRILIVCIALGILAFIGTGHRAGAATAVLTFAQVNDLVSEGIEVTMTDGASAWSSVDFHCNKYGGPLIYHTYTLYPSIQGPGTFRMDDPYPFGELSSGDWYAYAVAHGWTRTGPYTSQPWDAATASHDFTVP